MFGSQLVDCSGRIRKCAIVGGGMSLRVGFLVSKDHSMPSQMSLWVERGKQEGNRMTLKDRECIVPGMRLDLDGCSKTPQLTA